MWIAISAKGISKPFFFRSREAVNQKTYSQCIEKCLVPFIHQKYNNTPYIFRPDLASSHTTKSTLDLFKRQALNVVPKDCNPPNAPQILFSKSNWRLFRHFKEDCVLEQLHCKWPETTKMKNKTLSWKENRFCKNMRYDEKCLQEGSKSQKWWTTIFKSLKTKANCLSLYFYDLFIK